MNIQDISLEELNSLVIDSKIFKAPVLYTIKDFELFLNKEGQEAYSNPYHTTIAQVINCLNCNQMLWSGEDRKSAKTKHSDHDFERMIIPSECLSFRYSLKDGDLPDFMPGMKAIAKFFGFGLNKGYFGKAIFSKFGIFPLQKSEKGYKEFIMWFSVYCNPRKDVNPLTAWGPGSGSPFLTATDFYFKKNVTSREGDVNSEMTLDEFIDFVKELKD